MSYASYESINIRRLARMLPKSVWAALKRHLLLKFGATRPPGWRLDSTQGRRDIPPMTAEFPIRLQERRVSEQTDASSIP